MQVPDSALISGPASLALLAAVAMMLRARPVIAEATDGAGEPGLPTVTVIASGVSSMSAASAGDVTQGELASQPLLRPAAVLENVPGLIVTQHSGEGKANQYFLRGFNLDHGTDLATEIDNMPVNMPTHAHGQGYTDLNFLIPELISDLHTRKGRTTPTRGISRPRAQCASISLTRSPTRSLWATARMAMVALC